MMISQTFRAPDHPGSGETRSELITIIAVIREPFLAPPAPPAHAALSDTLLRWPVPYPLYTSALPYTPRGRPRLYPVPYPLPLLSSPYPTHLPSSASARDLLPTPLHLWQTSASFTISQSHTLTGNVLQFTFAAVRSFISCISRLQSTF